MDSPSGWSKRSLNELAEIESGEAPPKYSGTYNIMGANGPIGTCNAANFEGGYLVGRVGAAGAINSIRESCWASDNVLTLQSRPKVCADEFLGHLLYFLRPEQLATINAQPLITQTNLGGLAAFVPDLVSEQRKIAEILDTVDAAIRQTEALITKLEQMKHGLLHDLLTQGIDDNGELRDPLRHPEQFKDSPLGRIPREWEIGPIRNLSDTFSGGTPIRDLSGMYGGEIPWVKSSEVNLERISSTEETITERAVALSSVKWVPAGTTLV